MTRYKTYEAWLASRPRIVREVLTKFPPNSRIMVDGVRHYILGADEGGMLIVSAIDPLKDYDAARAAEKKVCTEHLIGGYDYCTCDVVGGEHHPTCPQHPEFDHEVLP